MQIVPDTIFVSQNIYIPAFSNLNSKTDWQMHKKPRCQSNKKKIIIDYTLK